jgi:hypothetical protein
MAFRSLPNDDVYILNHCTKYLARSDQSGPRHNFGQYEPGDPRAAICEAWRFPIIDSYFDGENVDASYAMNQVTFVYDARGAPSPTEVRVLGTFGTLYAPISMLPVKFADEETGYYALTVAIPKGQVHTYVFIVNGRLMVDPINPQQITLDDGEIWSRLFTHLCTEPITFERWELVLLDRLTDHILPFRTEEGQRFLDYHYNYLDEQTKGTQFVHAYRIDQSIGVINFIDKLLAREERHHLVDYRACLSIIDGVLRRRNPYVDPCFMGKEMFIQLYNEMASDSVSGWDYSRYASSKYFLQILRRHTLTGAFSHPKYGGNVGAAAWAFLAERYKDSAGSTLFDWAQSIESPLGKNVDYRG